MFEANVAHILSLLWLSFYSKLIVDEEHLICLYDPKLLFMAHKGFSETCPDERRGGQEKR